MPLRDRQPGDRAGGRATRPKASVEHAEAAAAAAAEAFPGVVAHDARGAGRAARPGRRPRRRPCRRAGPAGAGRDRRHPAGHQDDAGADVRRARFRRYARGAVEPTHPAAAERDADDRARPRRHHRRASPARRRSASSRASRRTTSRSRTWPASSARRWPWATPSWSSRRRRTRWPSIRLGEVFDEAGFPPGVVNVVDRLGRRGGEALVASPHVDMVSFTGSTGVGQRIGEVAGHDMKRLLLELGGKGAASCSTTPTSRRRSATIVSVWAFHSGQICTAPTRVLAQRGIYDQLVAGLAAAAGDAEGRRPARGRHRARPGDHRRAPRPGRGLHRVPARDEGGTVVAGGERPDLDAASTSRRR